MVMWDQQIETMPTEDIRKLQYRLLKTLVYRLYSFSPFYHERMKQAKVHPDDINHPCRREKTPVHVQG